MLLTDDTPANFFRLQICWPQASLASQMMTNPNNNLNCLASLRWVSTPVHLLSSAL